MTKGIGFIAHPSDDSLEEYAFERLPGDEAEPLEEHLLICEDCQERLRSVDEYILLMKSGARKAVSTRFRVPVSRQRVWVLTAVAAALVAGIALRVPGAPASRSAPVELVAFRGDDGIARATAGRKLDLAIDLSDLSAPSNLYRVQIVDAMGREQWSAQNLAPRIAPDAKLIAQISKPLKPGVYWVRVSSAEGELLREFGLRAE